jgi:steroid delta-isomerase-like uncharacterized protein
MKSSIKILAVLLAALVIFSGCQQQQDHSKELKPILDRGVAVWNSGNIEEVDEIWAPSAIRSANQLPDVEGIDGIKAVITSFRTAYPDAKLIIDEEVYSENKAIIRWTFSGTNTGEGEMPPTGKQINIWGISILHFENGKLTREYVSFDNQPLLEQLGFTLTPSSSDEES